MKKNDRNIRDSSGTAAKQTRSRITYEALIKTGFKLLKNREWDSITVAELAKTSGYSVGAFYARFRSKEELLSALVAHHREARKTSIEKFFSSHNRDDFIDALIKDIVQYHWKNRNFWRTAQVRGMRDPEFWRPIRQGGHDVASKTIETLSERIGRPLTDEEKINVRFAFQITFGTLNNAIINQPGPIFMNQKLFVEKLIEAFRLVSKWDKFKVKRK